MRISHNIRDAHKEKLAGMQEMAEEFKAQGSKIYH